MKLLTFQEGTFRAQNIKKNSYVSGNETFQLHIFLVFWEMELSNLGSQNFSLRKISYIFS